MSKAVASFNKSSTRKRNKKFQAKAASSIDSCYKFTNNYTKGIFYLKTNFKGITLYFIENCHSKFYLKKNSPLSDKCTTGVDDCP